MDLLRGYQFISSLILKERLGILTSVEAGRLQMWLAENPHHRELYDSLKQMDLDSALARYDGIDTEEGWVKYRRRYILHRIGYRWISAVVVAVLLIGTVALFRPMRENRSDMSGGIVPGRPKAELILGDGSVWFLDSIISEERLISDCAIVYNSGAQISYRRSPDTVGTLKKFPVYNELRVPVGGEYQLVLSDGTRVWLNSQSRLKYPVVFENGIREVELTGEAYFEVTPDRESPFRVYLRDRLRVEVLGTSFNIRDYPDEEVSETVLEEGAVQIVRDKDSLRLTPGMRGIYTAESDSLSMAPVDTELYTSWRSGHFVFRDEKLESILHKLSRWYEIHVVFRDEFTRDVVFSGSIRKYDTIEKLLKAIETAGGVRFEIQGNTVIVHAVDK